MPYAVVRDVTVEHDGQVRLDGLQVRQGQRVQVFVIKQSDAVSGANRYPLQGEPFEYDDPFRSRQTPPIGRPTGDRD